MEQINDLQRKISDENKHVAGQGRYVKVVLLMPLTVTNAKGKGSVLSLPQIKYALEGAYTAQYRANRTSIFGDPSAYQIQLLLANQGSRQDFGGRIVNEIADVSERDHPLEAVIGLGFSLPSTEAVVRKLGSVRIRAGAAGPTDKGVPMVSAGTSSDTLTGIPKLWSVSPSNIHYARALRNLLDRPGPKQLKSGIVVWDRNDNPYIRTLYQAYKSHLGPYLKFSDLSYRGSTPDTAATPRLFQPVVTNLCDTVSDRDNPLDMVFFAGRLADFESFARALENRTCKNRRLAVLVGATGFSDLARYRDILDRGNVTLFSATSADPLSWERNEPGTPPDFPSFLAEYKRHGFDVRDLKDGLAIGYHDALAVVASAIRLAGRNTDRPPLSSDTERWISQLVLANRVHGASGRLSFEEAAHGRAVRRVIPVLRIGTSVPFPKGLAPYVVNPP
jgi:hypothetical protein